MKRVSNWISYLHENSYIFSPFLPILINFLKSKNWPWLPQIFIWNPLRIWRHFNGRSGSFLQILHNHVLFQMFQPREGPFWSDQTLNEFEYNLNPFAFWVWIKLVGPRTCTVPGIPPVSSSPSPIFSHTHGRCRRRPAPVGRPCRSIGPPPHPRAAQPDTPTRVPLSSCDASIGPSPTSIAPPLKGHYPSPPLPFPRPSF
jgi:hypothetical protein